MSPRPLEPSLRFAAGLAALISTLMIAQQITSKALRDTLFLIHFPVSDLPILMMAAAGLSLVMVLVTGQLMGRFGPRRVVPILFTLNASLYAAESALVESLPGPMAIALYVQTATFGAAIVSGFWSLINERFDPHQAKRVFGTIGSGATFGGLVGGVAAWQGAGLLSPRTFMLALGGVNLVSGLMLLRIARKGARREKAEPQTQRTTGAGKPKSGLTYVRHIATFVVLLALVTSLFEYLLKAQAVVEFPTEDGLLTFFALFYTGAGLLTFLVHNGLVRRVLVRFGLTPTLGVLPSLIVLFGAGALIFPGFPSIVALRGAASTAENSFHRSGYELLYTPLNPQTKRRMKMLVDVGAEKLGTAVGSGLVSVLLIVLASQAESVMLTIVTVVGALLLAVLALLHKGYVTALAERMKSGVLVLDTEARENGIDEATARMALSMTLGEPELARLLSDSRSRPAIDSSTSTGPGSSDGERSVDSLRSAAFSASSGSAGRRRDKAAESNQLRVAIEQYQSRISELHQGVQADEPALTKIEATAASVRFNGEHASSAQVRREPASLVAWMQTSTEHDPVLVAELIPLLSHVLVGKEVRQFLRHRSPMFVGQLVDALTSPRYDALTRGHVASVLSHAPTTRAAEGLSLGLSDRSFLVAHQCAIGIYRICMREPRLSPEPERVFQWVKKELGRKGSARCALLMPSGFPVSPYYKQARGSVDLQMVHLFTLLGLALERSPLTLAFRAIRVPEGTMRGTALEYLENVLPADIWQPMLANLDGPGSLRLARPNPADLADLTQKFGQGQIDLAEFRAEYRHLAQAAAAGEQRKGSE